MHYFFVRLDCYGTLKNKFLKTSLQTYSLEAPGKLKGENAMCFYWQELLQKQHILNCQMSLSCDVLFAFCAKIYKTKVCYILSKRWACTQHEEDESALRQLLKTFHVKQDAGKDLTKVQPTDQFLFLLPQAR